MSRKTIRALSLLLTLALALGLGGCASLLPPAQTEPPARTAQPSETPGQDPEATPSAAPAASPTPPPSPEPTPEPTPEIEDWETLYLTFLSENYDALMDAYPQGMVGVGFIDLDLDGSPELLLFDQGASVSMGVQFFDVADGFVTCVSASMIPVGRAFGGDYFTPVYVNANFFEDFRLVERADGERFFYVESLNGNEEFSYSEIIRFGKSGGALSLESLLYKYEDYDPETGELSHVRCQVRGENVSLETYEQRFAEFFQAEDSGYAAAGVFLWNDKSYTVSYEGFMAMAEKAAAVYVPAAE